MAESASRNFPGSPDEHFRHVLSHVPTGVVVITSRNGRRLAGLAIGSFTSISLQPPLVGFYPSRSSTTWPEVRTSGRFCVNVLGHDQAPISARFSESGGDKFERIDWRPAPYSRAPILGGVIAWIDCEIEREIEIGDHYLVVGSVVEIEVERTRERPLVFLHGSYDAARS